MGQSFNTRIKWKRDTSTNWTQADPILLNGEIIIVDTNAGETRFKIGDGSKRYSALPFQDEPIRNLLNNLLTIEGGGSIELGPGLESDSGSNVISFTIDDEDIDLNGNSISFTSGAGTNVLQSQTTVSGSLLELDKNLVVWNTF